MGSTQSQKKYLSLFCLLILLSGVILLPPPSKAESGWPNSQARISTALSQAIAANKSTVWSDPEKQELRVLVQTTGPLSSELRSAITAAGGSIEQQFTAFNILLLSISYSGLSTLADRPEVERVTADHLTQQTTSHLEAATGADQVRQWIPKTKSYSGLDGQGIGIAILDSGIMATHESFTTSSQRSRVISQVDLVSRNLNLARAQSRFIVGKTSLRPLTSNIDDYGHGSHVAGAAAGKINTGRHDFSGIAFNANLIDIKVLNSQGLGQVSDALRGIDWVLQNKERYGIQVMNLSLGAASTESYLTDPLCRAVRQTVANGITVVVAAGNHGFASNGTEQYGSITAPGNEPSVITVGAVNTKRSESRRDDTITYFSSRGPTRGAMSDSQGRKQYDNLLKPDLVAPGNKLVAAESYQSRLALEYPDLHFSGSNTNGLMYLSGTSIAAPVVAGAAVLLLQKNPGLTPPLIKAILQYTAQQIPSADILQQGAGLLNIEGAVRLAGALRTDIASAVKRGTMSVGDNLLAAHSVLPAPTTTLNQQTFNWGGYIFAGGSHLLSGQELFTRYQAIYDPSLVWVRHDVTVNETPVANLSLITPGVIMADVIAQRFNAQGTTISNGLALGQGITLAEGITLSEGITLAEGITLSEGITLAEGITLSEGITLAEGITLSEGITLAEGITLSEGITLAEGITLSEAYNLGE